MATDETTISERPSEMEAQRAAMAEAHEALLANDLPRAESLIDTAERHGRVARARLQSRVL
ncbi:MAG TPA: hypothetical protein VNF68_04650 [Candidatus Baltobacteraceae bacterium]|nr:hypothetical protein [Candidatus Baltobacteraceae bacterium]